MNYSSHPNFSKEISKFFKKHHQDDGWLFKLQKLLIGHFEKNVFKLTPNKLVLVGKYKEYELFKAYMVVGGISKKDCPRVCFAKKEETIIFLCFGTHVENYNTKELILLGKQRMKEFVGEA